MTDTGTRARTAPGAVSDGRARVWAWIAAGLLVVLWAAAAVPLTLDAARVIRSHTTTRLLGEPVDAVVVQVQEERRLSAGYLADVVDRDALLAQRRRTDEACRRLAEAAAGSMWRTPAGTPTAQRIDDLVRRLDERTDLRTTVDGEEPGQVDGERAEAVVNGYTGIVAGAFAGAPWLWPDHTTPTGSALLALGRAREALSQQDAALIGDPRGTGTARVRATVVRLALARRTLLAEAAGRMPDSAQSRYEALAAEPATARLLSWEDRLLTGNPPKAAGPGGGDAAVLDAYRTRLREIEVEAVRQARAEAVPGAVATVGGAGLLAGVGLIAVIAVLVRLRRILAGGGRGGAAATTAARGSEAYALDLALEQNRRNQALLHRLLRMLDNVQRRVGDEGTLGELFRIDHLASRIRRNVEKTISLSGGTPGRRWTGPVPLSEVVRAAAAEVPGFERVSTAQVEPATLTGTAVADLMHLLAELIENAVAFSPAETRVRVSGEWVAGRYLLTVADHGPGMTDDDLRAAADVLAAATPPASRAWDGLYAAGRLAARYGIGVELRNAEAGGLLAEVTVPAGLLADPGPPSEETAPLDVRPDRAPATSGSPAAPRAHAPRVPRQRPPQRLRPGANVTPAGAGSGPAGLVVAGSEETAAAEPDGPPAGTDATAGQGGGRR